MGVCDKVADAPCAASGCEAVFANGQQRLVRRTAAGKPQMECWPDALAQYLNATAQPSFDSADIPDPTAVIADFLMQRPHYQRDVLMALAADGATLELQASVLHFTSTFVDPKPRDVAEGVIEAWDSKLAQIAAQAPMPMSNAFTTGRCCSAMPCVLSGLGKGCWLVTRMLIADVSGRRSRLVTAQQSVVRCVQNALGVGRNTTGAGVGCTVRAGAVTCPGLPGSEHQHWQHHLGQPGHVQRAWHHGHFTWHWHRGHHGLEPGAL